MTLHQRVRSRVAKEFLVWQPFVFGLAFFEKDFLEKATLSEQLLVQEVCFMSRNFKENQIVKSEWVERK